MAWSTSVGAVDSRNEFKQWFQSLSPELVETAMAKATDDRTVFYAYGEADYGGGSNFFWVVQPAKQKGMRWSDTMRDVRQHAREFAGESGKNKTVHDLVRDIQGVSPEEGREFLRNDILKGVATSRHWIFWSPEGWHKLEEFL